MPEAEPRRWHSFLLILPIVFVSHADACMIPYKYLLQFNIGNFVIHNIPSFNNEHLMYDNGH